MGRVLRLCRRRLVRERVYGGEGGCGLLKMIKLEKYYLILRNRSATGFIVGDRVAVDGSDEWLNSKTFVGSFGAFRKRRIQ